MTGQDQTLLPALEPPPGLGERQRSEPCDLPVQGARELVDHDPLRRIRDHAGDSGAEFFADAEHRERPQPCRHVAQTDRRKRRRDRVKVPLGRDGVHDRSIRRPARRKVRNRHIRPELTAGRTLSGSGGADDHADPPVGLVGRQFRLQVKIAAAFGVEQRLDAGCPVAVIIGTAVVDFDFFHVVTTFIFCPGYCFLRSS